MHKIFILFQPSRRKPLLVPTDPGYWSLDTRCFWISPTVHPWIFGIQYPASNICPQDATGTRFPTCPVEKILCNLGAFYFMGFRQRVTHPGGHKGKHDQHDDYGLYAKLSKKTRAVIKRLNPETSRISRSPVATSPSALRPPRSRLSLR